MKKGFKIAAAVVVIAAAAGLIFTRINKPKEELQTKELPAVTLTQPSSGSIASEESLIGSIQPSDTYYVMPKVAGELLEVYVSNGDTVNAGDPIARIDVKDQLDAAEIQLSAATSQRDSAQVQANTATDALNRMTPLYQAGDISAQEYESTQAQATAAQNAVKAAQSSVDAAQLQVNNLKDYATVTAPAAGTVQNTAMTVNATVAQSTQLCMITGAGAKTVDFNVTEEMLNNLEMGREVVVEKQGSEYHGAVSDIGSVANAQTGLFPIEATLTDAQALPDGTSCKVRVTAEQHDHTMLIPLDCVFYAAGESYVYTYDEAAGEVHKAVITTDLSDDKNIEVADGLNGSDKIVSSWTDELYDGAKVRIIDENGNVIGGETDASREAAETTAAQTTEAQ